MLFRSKIEVVHTTLPMSGAIVATRAAKSLGIPMVAHSHSQPENLFADAPKFIQPHLNNLWNKYPSVADDDAVVSMDAHSAIIYFISRGYKCITHKNFLARFFCRGSFIIFKKT